VSRAGVAAGGVVACGGDTASAAFDASGRSPIEDLVAVSVQASITIGITGSTPSGEGEAVALFIDARRDPLEIDAAGDPLLVQAGVSWIGRSASEVV
jgi:hypothetical protein